MTTTTTTINQRVRLYCGDSATVLKDSVVSESVDCVVTSPDYWQLRGDTEILPGEIGLEELYTQYIEKMMTVINEVHRVLKPTGTFFLVINDTYNTPKVRNTNGIPTSRGSGTVKQKVGMHEYGTSGVNKKLQPGIMKGSTLFIPHQIAIAMIKTGKWTCKNDITWYKRNGQPNKSPSRFGLGDKESIFFFVKRSEGYYFNPQYEDSITEPGKPKHVRSVWDIPNQPSREEHYSQFPPVLCNLCIDAGCPENGTVCDPFTGSGTTGLAALQTGRNFIGIDISSKFVEIARMRLLEFHGRQTRLF